MNNARMFLVKREVMAKSIEDAIRSKGGKVYEVVETYYETKGKMGFDSNNKPVK